MRVAIYARISLDEKHGQDISMQQNQCADYCARQGWEVVKVFKDEESGASLLRPEFRRMLLCAKTHEFDAILVWKLDRFARLNPTHSMYIMHKIEQMGIKVFSEREPWFKIEDLHNPQTYLVCLITFWKAWAEQVDTKMRVKAGIQNKKAKGEYRGGRPKGKRDSVQRERRWRIKPEQDVERLFS